VYGRAKPAREEKTKRGYGAGFARWKEETKEKEAGFARILKIFHFLLGKKKVEQRKPVPAALRAAGLAGWRSEAQPRQERTYE